MSAVEKKLAIHSGFVPAILISFFVLFTTISLADSFVDYFFSFYAASGVILGYVIVNIKKISFAFKSTVAIYSIGLAFFMFWLVLK